MLQRNIFLFSFFSKIFIFLLGFSSNFLSNIYHFIYHFFISIQSFLFFLFTNFKKNMSFLNYLMEDDFSLPHENEFLSEPVEMESSTSISNNADVSRHSTRKHKS